MVRSASEKYRAPYSAEIYGDMGLGDDASNSTFQATWPEMAQFIAKNAKLNTAFSGEKLQELEQRLRANCNRYLAAKSRLEIFSATQQKRRAATIVRKIDSLLPELVDLWQLNLPVSMNDLKSGSLRRSDISPNLRKLRNECLIIASAKVQPGAVSADHIKGGVIEFISVYEQISGLHFPRSKQVDASQSLKSPPARLLELFFFKIDPSLSQTQLVTAIVRSKEG